MPSEEWHDEINRMEDEHNVQMWATKERLPVSEVSSMVGIAPATFRAYVSRGQAPKPDGHFDARTPYWFQGTIDAWRPTQNRTPTETCGASDRGPAGRGVGQTSQPQSKGSAD